MDWKHPSKPNYSRSTDISQMRAPCLKQFKAMLVCLHCFRTNDLYWSLSFLLLNPIEKLVIWHHKVKNVCWKETYKDRVALVRVFIFFSKSRRRSHNCWSLLSYSGLSKARIVASFLRFLRPGYREYRVWKASMLITRMLRCLQVLREVGAAVNSFEHSCWVFWENVRWFGQNRNCNGVWKRVYMK